MKEWQRLTTVLVIESMANIGQYNRKNQGTETTYFFHKKTSTIIYR